MSLTRREAIGLGTGAFAGAFVLACAGDAGARRKPRRPEKKEARVRRLRELLRVRVPCDLYSELWTGPAGAVVHVTLTGGKECSALLGIAPPGGYANPAPGLPSAHPEKSVDVQFAVPEDHTLGVQCAGPLDHGHCTAVVTAVDSTLPQGVTAGTPAIVEAAGTVTDPSAPPPFGTTVRVSCNRIVGLWEGPSSFVTVRVRGSATCHARLYPEGDDMQVYTSDSEFPVLRTVGPVVALEARCRGSENSQRECEFQIVEIIELPA